MKSRISPSVPQFQGSTVRWRMPISLIASITGCLTIGCSLLPHAKAETFTLGASQDSMAYSFLAGWAMEPLYPNIFAAANTGTLSNHHMAGFLQFDLTPLALEFLTGDEIASATVRLFVLGGAESGFGDGPSAAYPTSVDFRLLESSWNEATITWSNQPGGAYTPTTTPPPGTLVATAPSIAGTGLWVEVDITDALQGWLNDPASNFGLRLTETTEVRDSEGAAVFPTFASSEYATESNRPQLVVETIPEPASAALLGISLGLVGLRRRRATA